MSNEHNKPLSRIRSDKNSSWFSPALGASAPKDGRHRPLCVKSAIEINTESLLMLMPWKFIFIIILISSVCTRVEIPSKMSSDSEFDNSAFCMHEMSAQ
ncbi:hypothetical protein NP493_532g01012 [Ridgeia piscesae]|uniref:Uncharacterized protein n=1 Tax=Ridgeia piscesae TaxID=27915 RepID=A0AAD9KW19_RIDPI|nr:hypothetical protein NP493_532g01012 [Ridgeia piscesae]